MPILLGISLLLASPSGAAGVQGAQDIPPDTYRDTTARDLVERGQRARSVSVEGLESFEGRLWERIYVGVSAARFRRERGVFREERSARFRWSRTDGNLILWDGARRDIPIVGISSDPGAAVEGMFEEDSEEARSELVNDLHGTTSITPFHFHSSSDRILFGGGNWALHPLSDTAAHHYRYRSGDTLRVHLPGMDEAVQLVEVLVEPRRHDFRLISGALWFEPETGTLARATFRPAAPFTIPVNASISGGISGRIARSLAAEIHYISVDHGLFDFRWWIPRRFTFEGEARVGGLVRFPVSAEWSLSALVANEAPGPELQIGDLPEGWRMAVTDSTGPYGLPTTVVTPPIEVLSSSPRISPPGDLAAQAFSRGELDEIERVLRRLPAAPGSRRPQVYWGLASGVTRYNRVEGLASGIAVEMELTREWSAEGTIRLGIADLEPTGELRFLRDTRRQQGHISLYRRLQPSSEWAEHSLSSSLGTFLWGSEYTPYHRAWGGEAVLTREQVYTAWEVRGFAERHGSVERNTDFHLGKLLNGDSLPMNPPATQGDWFGAGATFRWQSGIDPSRMRAFGRFSAEGAGGTSSYGRGWGSVALAIPVRSAFVLGVEGGGGRTFGDPPLQRLFFPGGSSIFRFSQPGKVSGEAFWFARGEVGTHFPGARLILFSDLLEVGDPSRLGTGRPRWASGVGASFLDGFMRFEVARDMRGVEGWRVYAYLDGLF